MKDSKRVEVEVQTDTGYYPRIVIVPRRDATTIKQLSNNVYDRIIDVSTEGDTAVVHIPNGRVKILPEHKKIKMGYSLRNGGRDYATYKCDHPDWLLKQSILEHYQESRNTLLPKRRRRNG